MKHDGGEEQKDGNNFTFLFSFFVRRFRCYFFPIDVARNKRFSLNYRKSIFCYCCEATLKETSRKVEGFDEAVSSSRLFFP